MSKKIWIQRNDHFDEIEPFTKHQIFEKAKVGDCIIHRAESKSQFDGVIFNGFRNTNFDFVFEIIKETSNWIAIEYRYCAN